MSSRKTTNRGSAATASFALAIAVLVAVAVIARPAVAQTGRGVWNQLRHT